MQLPLAPWERFGPGLPAAWAAHPWGPPQPQQCDPGGWAPTLGGQPLAGRLTERGGQEPVHHDVGEAADGRGEVRVERHVERVVSELLLVLQGPGAEVLRHLGWGGRGGEGNVGFRSLARPGWGGVCSARLRLFLVRGSLGAG